MTKLIKKIKAVMIRSCSVFTDRSEYRPAHCGNIRTLLLHLCDMDEQLCLWVLRWLAFPLRNPGAKMSTAVIINGYNGTGVSLFFEQVAARLHGDNARVITARQLHDSYFSRYAAAASFIAVDGDVAPRHVARLKELITAGSVVVSGSGQVRRTRQNRLNFVFMSSSPDFLPVDIGNRRFVVIEAPPPRQESFYAAIAHEIEHGGIDEFRQYLIRDLDMDGFNADTPPPVPYRNQQEAA